MSFRLTLLSKKQLLDLPRLALIGAVLLLANVVWPEGAEAGQVACTPTTGYNTCYRFTYSGVDQSFTVPTGVTSMEVRTWGAAGGGANSTYWSNQGGGGAGGHAKGTITVTSGQVIGLEVGQGGDPNSTSATYGWGGGGGNSTVATHIGASGGGMTGVFSSTTYSQATLLVGAGGGGGASPGADSSTPNAGGGGGTTGGQDAFAAGSGRGGTQSAGGAAATTNSSCSSAPTAGGIGNGGTGGSSNNSGTPNEGGGGGGGGYWGGGGGMCQNHNSVGVNGAGGGGSGFLAASVTSGSMTNGTNFPYAGGACSGTANSGGSSDPFYSAGIGQGSCFASGGDGEIVIQYHAPSITMSVVSNGAVGTFTMTGTNGYAGDSITTATSGVTAAGTLDALTNAATSTTVSVSVPAGYTFTNATCTGMGAGTMTPTYVNSVSGVTQTGTLLFNTTATAAANDIACTVTLNKAATFKLQIISIGSTGTFTPSASSNLASTPGAVTTVTAGTAAPVSPTAINISASGTAVTVSIPVPNANWAMTAVSCTDSNSAITGNTGTFGTLSGQLMTLPAADTDYGSIITCVVTETRASVLFQKISTGGVGTFTFASNSNLASTPGSITTTVAGAAAPASPTAINVNNSGTAVTVTENAVSNYALAAFSCTDANGAVTGNSGSFGTFASLTGTIPAGNVKAGSYITCVLTNNRPSITLTMVSNGGVTGFTFTGTNGWASQTITTVTPGVGVTGATQSLTTASTATTLTLSIPSGYSMASVSCSGLGSGTATPNLGTGAIVFDANATAAANSPACTVTANKTPTFKLQLTTTGGFGGAFSFTQTNLASAPPNITTTAVATATPSSPTAINVSTIGTAVTVTGTPPSGFDLNAVSCTDTNASVTGNSGTFGSIASNVLTVAAGNVVAGASFVCVLSSNKLATLTLTMKSNGGVTGFTFTGTNGWASQTITTVTSGTGVAGATQILSAVATATTVTQSIPSGYQFSSVSCTGLGSGTVTPTLGTGAMLFDAAAVAAGAAIACTVTDDKTPTFKLQVTTAGGFGGAFSFVQTNLVSAPSNITTTVAATATPSSPTAINVSTIGTAVTVTGTPPSGFDLNAVSCTDSNSALTNNTGTFGSIASNVLTVAAAKVVAGASFTCVLSSNKLPTLRIGTESLGANTSYTYTGSNGWTSASIAASPANTIQYSSTQILTAVSTSTTVTQTAIYTGSYLNTPTCTGMGAGGTASFSTDTITLDAAATAPGAAITCTFINTWRPVIKTQVITIAGTGGPFTFSQTNLDVTPSSITTTANSSATPSSPTSIYATALNTAVTLTQTAPAGYTTTSASCTDSNSSQSGNSAGSIGSLGGNTLSIAGANIVPGAYLFCVFTNTKLPSVTLTEVSNGAVGGFTFTGTNGWASQTITTVTSGVGVAGATQYLTTASTATNLSHSIPAGYTVSSISCTGYGSGSYTPNTSTGALSFDAAATAPGAALACTYTHIKTPTFKLQVTTAGGFGGAFSFAQTNLASAPPNITTTAAATATPSSPSAINVTTIGTAVTVTGTPPSGFDLNAVSCTDSNSAITSNTGTFGSIASNVVTVASAKVVAGADFVCVLSSNKLPTLTLTMKSNGGVTGFTFTGGNGWSSQTITTVTAGTGVAGATQTLTAASTATTVTQSIPSGYVFSSVSCTGLGSGSVTPTLGSGAMLFNALATAPGNAIACTVTDDKNATISLGVISLGGTGNFSFNSGTNVAITSGTIPTVTDGVTAPAPLVPVAVTSLGTGITFTEAPATGYALTSFNCTDSNSAVNGNTGNFGSFTGNAISISSSNVAAGGLLVCTATFTRPRVRIQKITLGGSDGPFTFSSTNLVSTPASITTSAVNTATPASPTPINVTTVGSAITITEPAFGGYFTNAATCTDANAAITGNSGSLGTLSGTTLTLPAGNVKAGADFTCVFTNTKGVPSLSIVKTASSSGPFSAGQTITYTYKVTNTGNVAVANVGVNDSHNGSGSFAGPANEAIFTDASPTGDSTDVSANNGTWSSLGPGDTVSFTASYVVTQHDVDYLQ